VALAYAVVIPTPSGRERTHEYVSDEPLQPGDVIVVGDRHWLIDRIEPDAGGGGSARADVAPARYRFRLRHPDGRQELGAFRRFRPGGPGLGHAFATFQHGQPVSWTVVDQQLAHDENGRAYLELLAERDYGEVEQPPDHELEHVLAAEDWSLSDAATATMARAAEAGLSVELVALEPGEAPDWDEAERYIDALIFEAIADDLLQRCGADREPREQALAIVKERLHADLEQFRADVEGDHDEIEEWDFRGERIFASVGSFDDEFDPDSGHGWMCRLVDSGALTAARFNRVRKTELV
jgi:hypothetical protein